MPTINTKVAGKILDKYKPYNFHQWYNTDRWRKLRHSHLITHPICQNCNKALAEEVHHVIPISTAFSPDKQSELAFNENNLMSVCVECHHQIHNKIKQNG